MKKTNVNTEIEKAIAKAIVLKLEKENLLGEMRACDLLSEVYKNLEKPILEKSA